MTSTRRSARPPASRGVGLLIGAAVLAAPVLAFGAPVDLYYERSVMTAANHRCGLFAPAIGAALAAGAAQARGAALRAGTPAATLNAVEQRARAKAAQTACNSADLTTAASRVRAAFEGYAKIERITYPGDVAEWRADRGAGRTVRWRLAQDVKLGSDQMLFGLAGRDGPGVLLAVADFPDGRAPYTARLVMRDAGRSLGPYLDTRGAKRGAHLPLAKRLPPSTAQKVYAAEARSEAGEDLAPKDMDTPWAFRFPAEAAQRLSALDPREAVAIEFVFAGQSETVRRAYVEVGDFAAGRAFLQLALR